MGWQNLNLLSHPNATVVPQARQSGEVSNYSLSRKSDILVRSLDDGELVLARRHLIMSQCLANNCSNEPQL